MKEMTETAPDTAAPSNLPELSVSELAQAVKRTMETNFDRVRVRGELGRVLIAKSGHLYVDLKDENATLSTVMWKTNVAQLSFKPEEGLEVVVEGRLSTYPGRSQYQLIAERMSPAGVGALLAQLEKLKARLQAEGLFAPSRKKPIPYHPAGHRRGHFAHRRGDPRHSSSPGGALPAQSSAVAGAGAGA